MTGAGKIGRAWWISSLRLRGVGRPVRHGLSHPPHHDLWLSRAGASWLIDCGSCRAAITTCGCSRAFLTVSRRPTWNERRTCSAKSSSHDASPSPPPSWSTRQICRSSNRRRNGPCCPGFNRCPTAFVSALRSLLPSSSGQERRLLTLACDCGRCCHIRPRGTTAASTYAPNSQGVSARLKTSTRHPVTAPRRCGCAMVEGKSQPCCELLSREHPCQTQRP